MVLSCHVSSLLYLPGCFEERPPPGQEWAWQELDSTPLDYSHPDFSGSCFRLPDLVNPRVQHEAKQPWSGRLWGVIQANWCHLGDVTGFRDMCHNVMEAFVFATQSRGVVRQRVRTADHGGVQGSRRTSVRAPALRGAHWRHPLQGVASSELVRATSESPSVGDSPAGIWAQERLGVRALRMCPDDMYFV
jgi:hypothetical protein